LGGAKKLTSKLLQKKKKNQKTSLERGEKGFKKKKSKKVQKVAGKKTRGKGGGTREEHGL